jgi:uncharacterized protein (TIGR03083 family)
MSNPVWPMLAAERSAVLDFGSTLSDADWKRASACAGWSVRDVLAHITAGAQTTPLNFAPGMAVSGFSFARLGARQIKATAAASPAELMAVLRTRVDARTLPGNAYLTEVLVHGEDMRWGVGTGPGEHAPEILVAAAEAVKKTGGPVHGKRRAEGLKLVATDVDWTSGEGPEVSGPLILLIMAMCGRSFALEQLTGAGTDRLASRA